MFISSKLFLPISNRAFRMFLISFCVEGRGYPFSTYAKVSEKLKFLTP